LSASVPSFSWETSLTELFRLLLEPDFEVLFPEEAGVGEAGCEDFLVAGDDAGAAVGGGDIGDADEGWGEKPGCASCGGRSPASRAPAFAGARVRRNISGWCAW
jgi:hypothetical protein